MLVFSCSISNRSFGFSSRRILAICCRQMNQQQNYESLKIIINQQFMMQNKESISSVEISNQPPKKLLQMRSASISSLQSQNLSIQLFLANDEIQHSINNQHYPLQDNILQLKVVKLIQSKLAERLVAFSFYKLRQNCLIRRVDNNFSVIDMPVMSNQSIQNPQSSLLGLQSRCQQRCQQKAKRASVKMLNKEMFRLKLENEKLTNKVAELKQEIVENMKRQNKEVMKKRQSLEGLMEEIADKNELIDQLRSNLRTLEARLGAKDKGILQCLLQEDSESLRKTVARLQAVNDKLNFNLQTNKKELQFYESQNKKLAEKCEQMEIEIKRLKQNVFDLEVNHEIIDCMKKEVDLTERRVKSKLEKTKKMQKKLSEVFKFKQTICQLQTEVDLQTLSRKTDFSSTASHFTNFRRTASLKSQGKSEVSENKLEAVLNFIFHIAEENYQLDHQSIFDDEQKELLQIHKQIFLKNKKNHCLPIQKVQTVDISYFFGQSLHEVFEDTQNNMQQTIAKLQRQRENLISKICELKQKHMHVRQVVMNFLKSFELKPLRKESEFRLNSIYEIFEYSEEERLQFSPPKSRKLFGFI